MRKHRREKQDAGNGVVRPGVPRTAAPPFAKQPAQEPEQPLGGVAQSIGGYRLVRVLGEGHSAVVHLGHAEGGAADEPRRTAAIKIYRSDVARERIDDEVAALTAVEHPHVVRLIDLAAAGDGRRCLVLERCAGGGLAQLVADRHGLAAGEAVTILAPLVAAVQHLHRAGVVHRDIRLSSVLFRDSGAPVLVGFGAAGALAGFSAAVAETHSGALTPHRARLVSPAALAADPEVLDDRRRLVGVIRAVLQLVDDARAIALDDRLATEVVSGDDFCDWLSNALFDIAEAQSLRRRDSAVESASAPLVRVVRPQLAEPATAARQHSPARERIKLVASVLADQARGVRRRVWAIAGGVAVSLLVAAIAIPAGTDDTGTHESAPTREALPADATAVEAPAAEAPATESPATVSPDTVLPGAESQPPDDTAVLGDDPVAALVALLAERQRCLRDLSVVCLDGVLQSGSAALARDVAVIRALQNGGEQTADDTVDTSGPVLVERLGDSALLDLGDVPETQPASALVMRGEAGWRIRDYLDDG